MQHAQRITVANLAQHVPGHRLRRLRQASLALGAMIWSASRSRQHRERAHAGTAREISQDHGHFEHLAKSGIAGFVVSDVEGDLVEANDEFLRITGSTPEDLRAGRLVGTELSPAAWLRANDDARAQLESSGATRPWEQAFVRGDGTLGAVIVAVTRLHPPTQSMACMIDISDKRRAEAALRSNEAQRQRAHTLEATGRLAGGVAHDFNNLLAIVLGYCDLLLKRGPDGADQRSELLEIKRAAELAADLTRQLLALSGRQVSDPRVVDLGEVVAKMDRGVSRTLGDSIALTIDLAPNLWKVRVDPGQIKQIMTSFWSTRARRCRAADTCSSESTTSSSTKTTRPNIWACHPDRT
jgi:PAS domain S-box-containing protein